MNRYFGLHTLEGEWHALLPRYMLLADRIQGARVLDIGCGTGIGSSLLVELGAQMVDAIDHRPAVLELGRMKHAKDRLDFHVMFWEELDFPDSTFDIVLCLDPSSPVTDVSLVREVSRVLKPSGDYVCAVERKTIPGLEALLPRYGYAAGAESIDVHQSTERVPQLGTLQEHFTNVASVIQRPIYGFQFDLAEDDEAGVPQQTRKLSEDESGVWFTGDGPESHEEGRWMSVDTRLRAHDTEAGSVALFFCTDGEANRPPVREIQMPYYGIVERLGQVVGDLQESQVRGVGDDDSIFEEVVDPQTAEIEEPVERHPTNEFQTVSWDEPTTIRQRPTLDTPSPAIDDEVDDLSGRVDELSRLYTSVRDEFQRVVTDATNALQERDRYIEHLVSRVHDWEMRYFERKPGESDESARDEVRLEELETEIARLRDEHQRLQADLEEKADFLTDSTDDSEKLETGEFEARSDSEPPDSTDEPTAEDAPLGDASEQE